MGLCTEKGGMKMPMMGVAFSSMVREKNLKPENVRDGVICRFGTNLIVISCRIKMQ